MVTGQLLGIVLGALISKHFDAMHSTRFFLPSFFFFFSSSLCSAIFMWCNEKNRFECEELYLQQCGNSNLPERRKESSVEEAWSRKQRERSWTLCRINWMSTAWEKRQTGETCFYPHAWAVKQPPKTRSLLWLGHIFHVCVRLCTNENYTDKSSTCTPWILEMLYQSTKSLRVDRRWTEASGQSVSCPGSACCTAVPLGEDKGAWRCIAPAASLSAWCSAIGKS